MNERNVAKIVPVVDSVENETFSFSFFLKKVLYLALKKNTTYEQVHHPIYRTPFFSVSNDIFVCTGALYFFPHQQ